MTDFEKELAKAKEEYKKRRYADDVIRVKDWKGYQIYKAVRTGKPLYLGYPLVLMAKESENEIRISTPDESMEYLDYCLGEE